MNENDIKLYKETDYGNLWDKWLKEVKQLPKEIKNVSIKNTDYGYNKSFYFSGPNNADVYGCLFYNKNSVGRPLIVLYHGLGAVTVTEGYQHVALGWVRAGYSVLGMDSRLQGGKTIDNASYEFQDYGLMAYNILDIDKYYSKYLFQDALQLIEIIDSLDEVNESLVVVTGGSKGAELSLMAAAKSKRVKICICDIPSGCFLPGRVRGSHGNYSAVTKLLQDKPELEAKVLKTLSYFDIIHLTDEIDCPVLASVGSIDEVCPPRFFKFAYERINSNKTYIEYEGYGHGGYDKIHMPKKVAFVGEHFKED